MRYDTRSYLVYRTERKNWKGEKKKGKKFKKIYVQKYRSTVLGIRGVSPEEEKEGYGGKN